MVSAIKNVLTVLMLAIFLPTVVSFAIANVVKIFPPSGEVFSL